MEPLRSGNSVMDEALAEYRRSGNGKPPRPVTPHSGTWALSVRSKTRLSRSNAMPLTRLEANYK